MTTDTLGSELKASNPKDIIGGDNLPLHLVPYAVKVLTAIGLFNGAQKYGRGNYRVGGVQATVYLDAVERHLEGIKNGEELDPVDGVPHLCGLFASAAIYADAWAHGYLIDNRMPRPKGFRAWVDRMTTHIPRLRKLHEGKDPRHYTIQDTPEVTSTGDKLVGPAAIPEAWVVADLYRPECVACHRPPGSCGNTTCGGASYTLHLADPVSTIEGQIRDGKPVTTRIDGEPVAKDEPYEGVTHEEDRLGCSFLRFLPEFGARRKS